jgi:hypothetical protein
MSTSRGMRRRKLLSRVSVTVGMAVCLLLLPALSALGAPPDGYVSPANPHFGQRWERTDKPVADGAVKRTWMWGPGGFTAALAEPYAESPDGTRMVQYFDKSRMEITHPDRDTPNLWYVTNGLLAKELMTGRLQVGDDEYEFGLPAEINAAGDPDDPHTPTYAALNRVAHLPAYESDQLIDYVIDRNGATSRDSALAQYDVRATQFVPETEHRIAQPFWAFMTSSGPVWSDDHIVDDVLFPNPFYAVGYPLTEAYWVKTTVGALSRTGRHLLDDRFRGRTRGPLRDRWQQARRDRSTGPVCAVNLRR